MNKNKIPAVMVSNIFLRNALIEALKKSNHKIDVEYITNEKIKKNTSYGAFLLNDTANRGAGFGKMNPSEDSDRYDFVSIEKMFELLFVPPFVPVEVKLNDEYTAVIQQDGSIKVGCQTFSFSAIVNLVREIENVLAKN